MSEFNFVEQSNIAGEFLRTYRYEDVSEAVIRDVIFTTAWDAKEPIRNVLRRHPNWDEEQQMIVFNEDYECGIDYAAISDFFYWVTGSIGKMESDVPAEEVAKYAHASMLSDEYNTVISRLDRISEVCSIRETDEYKTLLKNARELRDMYHKRTERFGNKYDSIGGKYVTKERRNAWSFFKDFDQREIGILTDEFFVDKVNAAFPNIKGIVPGMKTSKAIGKICRYLGLDTIKEYKDKVNPETGEVTQKDFGYNWQFAKFADAINPLKVSAITCISINVFDYWTSSFGPSWASCHTIDKENVDRRHNTYEGQYSSGTESYMLDGSSIVFYTINPEFKGSTAYTSESEMSEILERRKQLWRVPKSRRMMFHLAEDGNSFVYGRLYPDARDGGDTGLAAQFRNTFQKVLSECQREANLWTLRKGTGACSDNTRSEGTHYRDYLTYGDCGYCIRKGTEQKMIYIGHKPICPVCGDEHYEESNICCSNCNGDYYCHDCGDPITDRDLEYGDAIYCPDNENYYCCTSCANRDGVYWCDDDGEYHDQYNCFEDDYNGDIYSGDPEVTTEDGRHYASYEHAYDDGYDQDYETGDWYPLEELTRDSYNEELYLIDRYDWIVIGDKCYHDEDSAIADGNEFDEETEEWRAA